MFADGEASVVAVASPWGAGLELTFGVGAAATAVDAGADVWLLTAASADREPPSVGAGLALTSGVATATVVNAGDEAWLGTDAFADRAAACGAAKPTLASASLWCAGLALAAAPGVGAVDTVGLARDGVAAREAPCGPGALTEALAAAVGVARTVMAPDTSAPLTSAKANVVVDEGLACAAGRGVTGVGAACATADVETAEGWDGVGSAVGGAASAGTALDWVATAGALTGRIGVVGAEGNWAFAAGAAIAAATAAGAFAPLVSATGAISKATGGEGVDGMAAEVVMSLES
jgi:hypothetical protein